MAVLVLAIADAASSDSGGGEPGQPRPPVVAIESPGDLTLVEESSFEVHGSFSGHVVDVTVAIDGQPAGAALRGNETDTWRLPAERVRLAPGYHEIAATATGDAGSHTAVVRVVHDAAPYAFGLRIVPERLRLDPVDPGLDRGSARLLTFEHPSGPVPLELTVRVNPAGLAAGLRPAAMSSGDTAAIDLDARSAPPGDYQVVVTAITATEAEAATAMWVTVTGPPDPTATTATIGPTTTSTTSTAPVAAPHTLRYDVASTVTASSTDLPATDGEATWEITWPCRDARCDGLVVDGGPRGRVDFEIRYDPATEAFTFDFTLPQPENPNCPTNDVTGTLAPVGWDATGPVGFDYALDSALRCTTGDVTVSWAGSAVRLAG